MLIAGDRSHAQRLATDSEGYDKHLRPRRGFKKQGRYSTPGPGGWDGWASLFLRRADGAGAPD